MSYRNKAASADGESYMSVQALQSMRDHSAELLTRVQADTSLPDWAESKLTQAAQSLNDVYEYMAHGLGKTSSMDLRIQQEIEHMDHLNQYMYNGRKLEGLGVDEAGEIAFDLNVSMDQVMDVAKRMGLKTPAKKWS